MRTVTLVLFALCLLAGCGSSANILGTASASATSTTGSVGATIILAPSQFTTTSATVKAGQAVKFDNSAGGFHNLVIGTNGQPQASAGAPSALLAGGQSFKVGDIVTIAFPTAGTYPITCTIHPAMQATVLVTP